MIARMVVRNPAQISPGHANIAAAAGLVLATGFGLAKLLLLNSWHIWLEFLLLGLSVLPGMKQYNDQQ
jgi:hypothetical protein